MSLQTTLPYFARPHLLESVTRLLLSGANVTLFAPRRHGKTSFVRYDLLPALHEAGWFAARIDLWRNRDNPELGLVEGLEAVAYATPPRSSLMRLTGEQALEPTGVNGEYEIADQGLQIVLSNAVNQDLFRACGSRRAA